MSEKEQDLGGECDCYRDVDDRGTETHHGQMTRSPRRGGGEESFFRKRESGEDGHGRLDERDETCVQPSALLCLRSSIYHRIVRVTVTGKGSCRTCL